MLLRPSLLVYQKSPKYCRTWNTILLTSFIYVISYNIYRIQRWPLRTLDPSSLMSLLFIDPSMLDMVVVTGACFYIHSVASRFCALNNAWIRLPRGLVAIPGEWTQSEITMSMESIRLLHSDLCEVIKVFSKGYGPILLGYFVFSFVSLLLNTFFYFSTGYPFSDTSIDSIIYWSLPLLVKCLQFFIFHMNILVNASFTNEKKREIISYLRSCRIANLPTHTKVQIKLFMSQMSVFESNEISAYGIFNINMNFILTNVILLVTGFTTLVQMNDYSYLSHIGNVILSHVKKEFDYTNSTNHYRE